MDPADTSQACNVYGHAHTSNRPLQAVFACGACGFRAHDDHNAARAGLPSVSVSARGIGASARRGAIPWGTPTTREPDMPAVQPGMQVPSMLVPSSRMAVVTARPVSSLVSKPWFGGDRFRSLARSRSRPHLGRGHRQIRCDSLRRNSVSARRFERRFRVESEKPAVLVVCSPN